jgi:dTDP-4-dehydrorhamnose reductase
MNNKNKVLILGARGNLGGQLVKVFSESGYEVIGQDKEVDITDKELIFKKVGEVKPAIVINAAAYNAVDKCEENEDEFFLAQKLNVDAVEYLADATLAVGAILVHYSTDYVFGGVNEEKIKPVKANGGFYEDDEPAPVNKYAETKLAGEKKIIERSRKGLHWYLIRTSKLFGPRGQSRLVKPSFFDIMLSLARKREELAVVNEEISCFTYTPDLAQATKNLIVRRSDFGIYHLVNSGPVTWYEGARELFRLAGVKIKIKPVPASHFPRPAKRPQYSVLANTKFAQLRPWSEALVEYLNYYL